MTSPGVGALPSMNDPWGELSRLSFDELCSSLLSGLVFSTFTAAPVVVF